jgi:hypothetical protein
MQIRAAPCCCKVDSLDSAVSTALLAFEQQVHQLHTLTLDKRSPAGRKAQQKKEQAMSQKSTSTENTSSSL